MFTWGVKFKGRGLIQITGRSNYSAVGKYFGMDFIKHPELLETPEWAFTVTKTATTNDENV